MQVDIAVRVFLRDFRKQRKRLLLTLVALAWGTISVMLLLAFGEGLHQQLTINNIGMGKNIAVVWGGQTSIPYKGLGKGRPIYLHQEDIAFLKQAIPEMKEVGGEYDRWGVEVRYRDKISGEHINGVTPNYEEMRHLLPEVGGRMINQRDIDERRRVAFLGDELKKRVFGDEDPIGEEILIQGIPFTVIGVMIHKMQMNMYSGPDDNRITIPLTTFKAIFGDPYLDNIIYSPKDPSRMAAIEARLFEVMGARYKFDPRDDRALSIWDTIAGAREMDNMLMGIKIFLGIIGSLTLLIAGVGVANIMYVSIKERTREIGIKLAVGARRSAILIQFLGEALLITFLGGLIGMGVSIGATELFKSVPLDSDVINFMGRPTVSVEIGLIVVVILGVMGLFSGLFPALKAASVSPVESLRYE